MSIRERVLAGFTPEEVPELLDLIGEQVKAGVDPEEFRDILDVLLDTEMEDRDRYAEEVWAHENAE